MVKELLRKKLTESQYRRLARIKRLIFSPRSIPIALIRWSITRNTFSRASRLDLKQSINLVERMDYQPHNIFLHIDSECELSLRLHSCKKEPDTVEWIEEFLKPGDVLYDIGANVGAYSLVAAKKFGGQVKVYAFEPAFLNFAQLCKNIHLNNSQGTIVPLAIALSDKTEIGEFNYHNLTPGGSLHALGEAVDHQGEIFEPVYQQPMLSYRIDDLIEQFGVPVPNHIKIDVDGIELSVLKGADKTLACPAVRSLVVEAQEGESERRITEYLGTKGFCLHSQHKRLTPGMLNYIFWRGRPEVQLN